jgi:hypothetical protein
LDQEREKRLQPIRVKKAIEELEKLGFTVEADETTIAFYFKGSCIRYFPYSGWASGKTIKDGRGLERLLKQLEGRMNFKKSEVWNFMKLKCLDKYLTGHKGFIAGGVFKNIFNKEKFKDIDLFFRCESDWEEAVKYYDENSDYYFYYENEKVRAFKNKQTYITVECIKEVFGTPQEIIEKFDFTITQFSYYKVVNTDGEGLKEENFLCVYHEDFFTHLHLKRLVIDNTERDLPYIVSTYNRLFKYGKYGYFPCRGTKIKVISELRKISDEEMSTLDGSLYDGFD